MSLAKRLTQLRINSRQSIQDVADALSVSKTHIWELEKGRTKNPTLELLTKLADHYEVTIRFLVGEEQSGQKNDKVVRMFRQVESLDPSDVRILEDMVKSMKKRRNENESEN